MYIFPFPSFQLSELYIIKCLDLQNLTKNHIIKNEWEGQFLPLTALVFLAASLYLWTQTISSYWVRNHTEFHGKLMAQGKLIFSAFFVRSIWKEHTMKSWWLSALVYCMVQLLLYLTLKLNLIFWSALHITVAIFWNMVERYQYFRTACYLHCLQGCRQCIVPKLWHHVHLQAYVNTNVHMHVCMHM